MHVYIGCRLCARDVLGEGSSLAAAVGRVLRNQQGTDEGPQRLNLLLRAERKWPLLFHFSPKFLVTASDPTCHSTSAGFCYCPSFAGAPPEWGPTFGKPQTCKSSSSHDREQHVEGPCTTQAFWKVCVLPGGAVSSTFLPSQNHNRPAEGPAMS